MKKALLMISILAFSNSIFAATQTKQSIKTLHTDVYNSEEKAQQAGFKLIHDLRDLSSQELSFKLGIIEPMVIPDSVKINNSELKVESIFVEPEKATYRGLVNVDYQYQTRESNE